MIQKKIYIIYSIIFIMEAYIIPIKNLQRMIKRYNNKILVFNPTYVYSKEQVLLAATLAQRVFENGHNVAKKLPIEFLIRLSGKKQISKAVSFGMKELKDTAGIIILDGEIEKNMGEVEIIKDETLLQKMYELKGENIEKEIYEKMALIDL